MAKRMLEGPAMTKGSALVGNLQIDSVRGQMRVRAWPKKRGKRVAPGTKAYNDWFRDCLALIKRMEPGFLLWCMERTKGTNIYPRDLAMQLLSGRGVMLVKPDGTKYFPEAYMEDVSLALDSLGQEIGALLLRGPEHWEQLLQGLPGQVLTSGGPDVPPAWTDLSSGSKIARYGATFFNPSGATTFNFNNWGGAVFQLEADIKPIALTWRIRAASATATIKPGIFRMRELGQFDALLAQGPAVVGTTIGVNLFPFDDSPVIPAGTLICAGAVVTVASVSATNVDGVRTCNVASTGAYPTLGTSPAYNVAGWGGFNVVPL